MINSDKTAFHHCVSPLKDWTLVATVLGHRARWARRMLFRWRVGRGRGWRCRCNAGMLTPTDEGMDLVPGSYPQPWWGPRCQLGRLFMDERMRLIRIWITLLPMHASLFIPPRGRVCVRVCDGTARPRERWLGRDPAGLAFRLGSWISTRICSRRR